MNSIVESKVSEGEMMQVLQSSLYPGAALDSIRMVLGYCKAAGLDPMQKPVHIVPMWNREIGRMVDVIMPGVQLYRIQASRSGQFAGVSEPEFGPDITANIGGVEFTYPDWCKVVVKRQLASGHVAEFTAREYWMENYAVKGGKEKSTAPNAMWSKRPRGQLAKCATAQALRAAFPEIAAQYTHEEMEGKTLNEIHEDGETLDQPKYLGVTVQRAKVIRAACGKALELFNVGDDWGAYGELEGFQSDEDDFKAVYTALHGFPDLRAALKRCGIEARERQIALDKAAEAFKAEQSQSPAHAG
jgi:phage recombination protein Bet